MCFYSVLDQKGFQKRMTEGKEKGMMDRMNEESNKCDLGATQNQYFINLREL